jgi:lysine 2,3-aminomutase
MEVTPLVKKAVERLNAAGWIVTNQLVFTAAASRRGHTAKLRKILNDIGIISYYTFTVKGFMENYHNFATNERSVQERVEEKYIGNISKDNLKKLEKFHEKPEKTRKLIQKYRKELGIPFLSTDRSVLNMPGVGKSMTFRTIGITDDGRRILEFEHDNTRNHSPIVKTMGNVVIIESKSINNYLKQMDEMGEDTEHYKTVWGYSVNETEIRMPVYQYPEYDFKTTDELRNFMSEPFAFITDELISAN